MPTYEDDIESDLTEPSDDEDELEEEPPATPPTQAQTQTQTLPSPLAITERRLRTRKTVDTTPQTPKRRALRQPRTISYPTRQCLEWIHDETVSLEAEYQRDVVWPEQKMTMLIDSILHNYYMPPIIFCVKNDPETRRPIQRVCIDGKQRLTSIQRFMDGDLPHKDAVTGKKLWFETKGIRGRKQIPEDVKKSFVSTCIVCVEYDDLDEKEERELFSRVQNGIALTPAERMQAFNGPYPDLIRTVGKEVTKCFGDQLNWGKLRGRDFQSIAQILYLIEYSTAKSTTIPPEPSTAKVETWLNSQVETPIPDDVKRSARTVFLLLCVLVLDIDEEGWDAPFRTGPHKFSPIEFVLSAYMIFLHGKILTISQLSAGVKHLRDHARKGKDELRFNSATYKDLVKYVRKEVKDVVLNGVFEDEGGPSAFEWAGDNGRRIREAVESSKTMVKSEGPSTLLPPTSSKGKRKVTLKVDKDGDSEMGAEDSDVPLRDLFPKRTRDVAQESKPLKTRKSTQDSSSISTPARSVNSVVKIEKSTTTGKKRKRQDDEDHLDDKVSKNRKTTSTSSVPSQPTVNPGRSKRSQTASETTRPPSDVAKPGAPSNAVAPPSVAASGGSAALPSFKKISKKASNPKKQQIQQPSKPGNASTIPHTSSVAEYSVLPSASASTSSVTSSTHQAPTQTPVQQASSLSLPHSPGWAPPQYPVNRPPLSSERLSLLREAKQRIELDNQAAITGGRPSVPSGAPAAPGPTRDPRLKGNGSGLATPTQSPSITSAQPNPDYNQASLGCVPRNPNQLEQRPVHPGSGLPSPLQTPTPPSPIIMSDPPTSPHANIVFTAAPEPAAEAMNSCGFKTLPPVSPDAGLPQRPLTPSLTSWEREPVKSGHDTPSHSLPPARPPVPTAPRHDYVPYQRRNSSRDGGNPSRRRYDHSPQRYDNYPPRRQYDNYSPRQRDYDRYAARRRYRDDDQYYPLK